MDRSNSTSSNASTSSKVNSSGSFAYQARLLERTSSKGGGSSLSRSNSQSGIGILANPTGSSTPVVTRRWTHRSATSLDATRGLWEERAKEAIGDENTTPQSPTRDMETSRTLAYALRRDPPTTTDSRSTPQLPNSVEPQRTPTYLKRRTMPSPIIASPLSPNTTGVTVENDSSLSTGSSTSQRIHLPSAIPHSGISSASAIVPGSGNGLFNTSYRANTLDTLINHVPKDSSSPLPHSPSKVFSSPALQPSTSITSTPLGRMRPASPYGLSREALASPQKVHQTSDIPTAPSAELPTNLLRSSSPTKSVMHPPVYRSSYMSNKKSYGDNLGSGRRLGRHLPRIASGDAEEPTELEKNVREPQNSQKKDTRKFGPEDAPSSPDKLWRPERGVPVSPVPNADDVAGLPGRIQLKAPSSSSSLLPSARLLGSSWADTQRHLIQAYEYLCHVGEAQQWIEGCLGEELEFGVVEMEDGLRNGVVLAKLVRTFQGESAVRKIYDAPKLDFRHSDNINYFFTFVRYVGLPEGFIFELTDLYEKKNLPKVIYCIHALSHLLARKGMAERIGNLLGRLQFSDDQLRKTQKGLKDAGVPMPNFGNVGRELAKEINEEPEVEVESEEERRDRLLLENEDSIVLLQARARGFLARRSQSALKGRIILAARHVPKLQAHLSGVLLRKRLHDRRQKTATIIPWVVSLQSLARGVLLRRRWRSRLRDIRNSTPSIIRLQAHLRGVLRRRQLSRLLAALRSSRFSVTKLQAIARARVVRNAHKELSKSFSRSVVNFSIVALQAHARGAIMRRSLSLLAHLIERQKPRFIALQAHCRGVILRRRLRTQMAKLEDVSHVVVRIQAAVRTYLSRKRLLLLIRGLRKATPAVIGFQTFARASLARQRHESLQKALTEVKTVVSVGGFQALARAKLARNRHQELTKTLKFAAPNVIGFQAATRGALVRLEYNAWRDHLHRSHLVASLLQAMLRGALFRRSFRAKMQYYRANLNKVIKIQSLFRAKETREQYRQLTLGKNVTVGTIKNFVHLLDDSEADFQEEIKVERLRKKVVESIRENQVLESDLSDLDVKIGLVVQNVIKARRPDSAASHAARISLLAAHGDPFSGTNSTDQTARRKLELYQQLFYLLQTRGEYLSQLFIYLSSEGTPEASRRFLERVVLTLFGFGQDRREDYLLLKLFQLAIREEIMSSVSINDIISGHPMYINIAVHYARPKQNTYARDAFQTIIREMVSSEDLDLEADPSAIHRARIELEEVKSGLPSSKAKDLSFREALGDPDTRPIYIRHLQVLQWWTEAFVNAIKQSTKKMPYGVRYLARETLVYLREQFPDAPQEAYVACIGRLVYYRYLNPAIVAPETFDIVSKTISTTARMNLAQISKVLTQITSGRPFDDDNPMYVPINDYVLKAITEMSTWLLDVADVPDAETQFHAHEFLDATVQPKPIYISPNEIYTIHGLLSQHLDHLAPTKGDTLRIILTELDGVPNLGNEELKDARDKTITLELTNRFAHVRDPHAEEKTLWVQAKRGVLAILRVQPAQDLLESLMRPVTDEDESRWEDILEAEMENEQMRHPRRQPSAYAADSAYRLEDIRSLKFAAVKALAISNLLDLEKQGRISRDDGFQGILDAIAGDVRSKHRKRIQRQQEMQSMNEALRHLAERKKYFEEQIDSYHNYVETAMNTMQRGKGKKRFVLPFTKQFYHLRELQKTGESVPYGSFIYSAKQLYEKGILLSIDQYSPRQFDKIQLTMSSKVAGVFTLRLESTLLGVTTRIASEDIRMEDLLQAKYEKRSSITLFNGKVNVNFELFLDHINKKTQIAAPKSRETLSQTELGGVLQQVYEKEQDGSKTLLVPYRERVSRFNIKETPHSKFLADAPFFPVLSASAKAKPNIDAIFFRQLRSIVFRIAFPSLLSKETLIVLLHSFFLVLRTVLSVIVAKLDGRLARDLVSANGKEFIKGLGLWFLLAIPSTCTNSFLRHLQSKLSLNLRTRLTRYTHDLYLSSAPHLRFYRPGLEGVDQYITADIEAWSEALSGLYGNILKPSLDLILFTSQLSRSLGLRGTILLFGNYYATVAILRAVTPAFGRLAAVEAKLEGEYRAGMGRVGREAEEIAFYDGGLRERDILTRAYLRLIKHVNSIYKIRIAYEWTEDYVIKYLWSAAGYGLIAVPLLYTRTQRALAADGSKVNAIAGRTESYVSNRRLLMSLADAGGRLMYAYKDLLELAGLTTRLYTLLSSLHNLPPLPNHTVDATDDIMLTHVDVAVPPQAGPDPLLDGESSSGVSQNAHPLVQDLSLVIKDGDHLMITGSNGVGKTAVARVLAGLWAPQGLDADVRRPADTTGRRAVFVVPQRAYMVTGSLLDQIIYPHSYPEFLESEKTEKDLMDILEMVFLAYLPEREGGWATRKEWRDVLSGGEKQRMAMARVFYHRPRFAILDECTSAVSSDVEGRMYEHAKALGITLITVSLRPSLMKYHTHLLTLSGDGSAKWTLTQVGTAEERMGIDREIQTLTSKLSDVEKWEERVRQLNALLSKQELV
ncbi:hypothetical protein H0H92_011957 [Tricholoma furcatifolium]|nr:hypothetical protein H0H92_011957 [Tricholoma furcatifolium]